MPFCGFNQKMVRGLVMFGNGLYDATHDRAKEQGTSIEKAFANEVAEMKIFLDKLACLPRSNGASGDCEMTTMIHGMAVFVEKLFESALNRARAKGERLPTAFKRRVAEMADFLEALENEHQALKRRLSPRQTITRTVQWIQKHDRIDWNGHKGRSAIARETMLNASAAAKANLAKKNRRSSE